MKSFLALVLACLLVNLLISGLLSTVLQELGHTPTTTSIFINNPPGDHHVEAAIRALKLDNIDIQTHDLGPRWQALPQRLIEPTILGVVTTGVALLFYKFICKGLKTEPIV